MAKMSDLKDVRENVEREHENIVRKIWTETNMLDGHIISEWDGVLSRYHSVLRSVWCSVEATDE